MNISSFHRNRLIHKIVWISFETVHTLRRKQFSQLFLKNIHFEQNFRILHTRPVLKVSDLPLYLRVRKYQRPLPGMNENSNLHELPRGRLGSCVACIYLFFGWPSTPSVQLKGNEIFMSETFFPVIDTLTVFLKE